MFKVKYIPTRMCNSRKAPSLVIKSNIECRLSDFTEELLMKFVRRHLKAEVITYRRDCKTVFMFVLFILCTVIARLN